MDSAFASSSCCSPPSGNSLPNLNAGKCELDSMWHQLPLPQDLSFYLPNAAQCCALFAVSRRATSIAGRGDPILRSFMSRPKQPARRARDFLPSYAPSQGMWSSLSPTSPYRVCVCAMLGVQEVIVVAVYAVQWITCCCQCWTFETSHHNIS